MSDRRPGIISDIRALPRPVWVLFGGTFINRFGGFVIVFMVLYLTQRGLSPAEAGIAVAGFGLGSLGGSTVGGYLADRIGRRETIAISMFTSAVTTMALLVVSGLPALVAVAVLVGLTQQLVRAPTGALIADLVPQQRRVAAMGVMRFFINAGFALGPATAGFLADRSFVLVFSIDALTSVAFGVLALVALPHGAPRAERPERRGEGTRAILSDRGFILFLFATLAASAVYLQAETTFPLWVVGHGYSNTVYGFLIALNGGLITLVELVVIAYTRRFSPRLMIAAGFLLVGFGFAATAWATTLALLALTVLIWTLGEMTAFPMSATYVADISPAHLRGRYAGAWGLTWSLGLMIGPGFGGWLFTVNPTALWLSCGVTGVLAAVLVMLSPGSSPQDEVAEVAVTAEAPPPV
ncbi:MAG: hypothetical protein QOE92_1868 [Chloroflexota bacterium]|jgi:MFS family permease|nr:hypothetical protein [Chloroflexota bacterium]